MNIKVMHIIGQLVRGGAERQLVYLAKALQNEGWPQIVVTFNPGDVLESELTHAGISVMGIPRSRNKLARLWQLQQLVNRVSPAILHSWSNFTNFYVRWIRERNSSPLKIVSFRDNPIVDPQGRLMRHFPFPGIYRKMDCVVANSNAALKVARAAGVVLPRVEIVRNFVVPQGRANLVAHTEKPIILAAGALIRLKAYDVLLYALHELNRRDLAYELWLAGEGPEHDKLQKLVFTLGLGNQVKLWGDVEDLAGLLQRSDIFVHPSRSESSSNAILEAMNAGLPVVAANVGGNPELIESGKTGVLVPVDNPVALADALEDLLKRPELRMQLGERASSMIGLRYGFISVLEEYKRIYMSLLSGR